MGLTLVAVGVSAPDAISSLCVAKQGNVWDCIVMFKIGMFLMGFDSIYVFDCNIFQFDVFNGI